MLCIIASRTLGYFGYYYIFLEILLVFSTSGPCTYEYIYIFFIDIIEVI